jgi:hypothetical protein
MGFLEGTPDQELHSHTAILDNIGDARFKINTKFIILPKMLAPAL